MPFFTLVHFHMYLSPRNKSPLNLHSELLYNYILSCGLTQANRLQICPQPSQSLPLVQTGSADKHHTHTPNHLALKASSPKGLLLVYPVQLTADLLQTHISAPGWKLHGFFSGKQAHNKHNGSCYSHQGSCYSVHFCISQMRRFNSFNNM